jgi:nitric oxide dioxygenase
MLTEKSIAIVKSTAPVLEQHGEFLTRHFYKRMFEKNPEVGPFFNPANQAKGVQQVHLEFFGPRQELGKAASCPV